MNIENISEKIIKDAIVEIPIPEEVYFTTERVIITEGADCEFVEYKDKIATFRINEIKPEEVITLGIVLITESIDFEKDSVDTTIYFTVNANNRNYYSNEMTQKILQSDTKIDASQTSDVTSEYVEDKDIITFTFDLSNTGILDKEIYVEDILDEGLVLKEAYLVKNGEKTSINCNTNVTEYVTLKADEKAQLVIVTQVDVEKLTKDTITNYATIKGENLEIETNKITYKVKGVDIPDEPTNPDDESYQIEGTAWLDENENGAKDSSEITLSNMTVYLIDAETNEIVQTKTTEAEGKYRFENVQNGNYMIIFEYDTTKYAVTEYQKQGVSENNNSSVISTTKVINGQEKNVAITKTFNIDGSSISNINAGFVELKIFDMKLDKYINKVIIQTNKSTTVKQFDRSQLAKIELDSKTLANTTIVVEYKILVTNEGEIPGYANEIVDIMPKDLTFNSELKLNWVQSTDQNLYSRELANQIINPGETKEITLTLTKKMTANNTGTSINTAEINKASNSSEIADKDSTPGNRRTGEDDISTANLIISIKTGGVVEYTILFIVIAIIIILGVYIIKTKVLVEDEDK